MKKELIIGIVIGVLLAGSIGAYAAIKLSSSEISYKDTTVEQTLNSLYISRTNNDYSTDEKVIGKWIDGKPIYQKTFICSNNFNFGANSWFSLNSAFSDITSDFVSSIDSLVDASLRLGKGYPISAWILVNHPSNDVLGAYTNASSGLSKGEGTLTLQYTKTTD